MLTSRETNDFPVQIEVLLSEDVQERVDGSVRCLENFGEQEALQSKESALIAPGAFASNATGRRGPSICIAAPYKYKPSRHNLRTCSYSVKGPTAMMCAV